MTVGDLVKIKISFTPRYLREEREDRIAMIVEGPNEVGNIRLLLSDGSSVWRHSAEVEYLPKAKGYLK